MGVTESLPPVQQDRIGPGVGEVLFKSVMQNRKHSGTRRPEFSVSHLELNVSFIRTTGLP